MFFKKKSALPLIFSFILSAAAFTPKTQPTFSTEKTHLSANETFVVPGGKSIGVTLSTDGVMVVNLSEFTNKDGKECCPAKEAGIKPGDIIISFANQKISNVNDLNAAIRNSGGNTSSVAINRNNKKIKMAILPQENSDGNQLTIGAWVKDAASGIGTITFYNPETKFFSALGHGICDPETGHIISTDGGEILSSTIVSVDKSEKGSPGELKGVFSEDSSPLGSIIKNTHCGIWGTISEDFNLTNEPIQVAYMSEIKPGAAHILANIEGNIIEKFDIEILRTFPRESNSSKNMIIKITDENLIRKTGGIVQGMSGCPIIQNNKLVGAITHVFVNEPTKGYGIYIENMLTEK